MDDAARIRRLLAWRSPSHRRTLLDRLEQVGATLGGTEDCPRSGVPIPVFDPADRSAVWLVHAAVSARLPPSEAVLGSSRRGVLDGPLAVVADALERAVDRSIDLAPDGDPLADIPDRDGRPAVEVIEAATIVLLDALAPRPNRRGPVGELTGELVRRWHGREGIVFAHTANRGSTLRRVDGDEAMRLSADGGGVDLDRIPETVSIPWRCHMVMTELPDDPRRSRTLAGLCRFGGGRSSALCHVEFANASVGRQHPGEGDAIAQRLFVGRHLDRIIATSATAAAEITGWSKIISASGSSAPEPSTCPAPPRTRPPRPPGTGDPVIDEMDRTTVPIVLASSEDDHLVDHLGTLHAARTLWNEGRRFKLVFASTSDRFPAPLSALVEQASELGDGAEIHVGCSPDRLAGIAARATVLLHPSRASTWPEIVARCTAVGTPVITAAAGLLGEWTAEAGIHVDTSDDRSIAGALRLVLDDPPARIPGVEVRLPDIGRASPAEPYESALDRWAEQVWNEISSEP